jgi:hypothetical protein
MVRERRVRGARHADRKPEERIQDREIRGLPCGSRRGGRVAEHQGLRDPGEPRRGELSADRRRDWQRCRNLHPRNSADTGTVGATAHHDERPRLVPARHPDLRVRGIRLCCSGDPGRRSATPWVGMAGRDDRRIRRFIRPYAHRRRNGRVAFHRQRIERSHPHRGCHWSRTFHGVWVICSDADGRCDRRGTVYRQWLIGTESNGRGDRRLACRWGRERVSRRLGDSHRGISRSSFRQFLPDPHGWRHRRRAVYRRGVQRAVANRRRHRGGAIQRGWIKRPRYHRRGDRSRVVHGVWVKRSDAHGGRHGGDREHRRFASDAHGGRHRPCAVYGRWLGCPCHHRIGDRSGAGDGGWGIGTDAHGGRHRCAAGRWRRRIGPHPHGRSDRGRTLHGIRKQRAQHDSGCYGALALHGFRLVCADPHGRRHR